MAIRIIKQKKPYPEKPMRTKCQGCGSVIEFLKSDAKFVFDARDGSYYELQCPVCPRRITREPDKVYV